MIRIQSQRNQSMHMDLNTYETAQNHLIRYIWYHKFVELELSSKLEAESSASRFVVEYVCA
jgi:hypothetical protein